MFSGAHWFAVELTPEGGEWRLLFFGATSFQTVKAQTFLVFLLATPHGVHPRPDLRQVHCSCAGAIFGVSAFQPCRTPESRAPTSAAGSARPPFKVTTPSPLAPHTLSEPPPGYSPSATRPAFDAFAGPSNSVPRPLSSSGPDTLQSLVHKGKTCSELYDATSPM